MSYRLEQTQVVGGTLEDVFAFFKTPNNLEQLTPAFLRFTVLRASDHEVRLGTTIDYRLTLHGLPLRWSSRISEFVEGEMFADEMTSGPYRRWYHRHLFRKVPGGVEIGDIVEYELPLGPLGRLARLLVVRRQLETIFSFRRTAIAARFPSASRLTSRAVP